MSVYMVTDENGYPLTDGLQEHEIERVAQAFANDRKQSVWYHEHWQKEPGVAGSETVATEDIEVKPTHQNENQNENQT